MSENIRVDSFKAMILAKILLERIHGYRWKFICISVFCGAICTALGYMAFTSEIDEYIGAFILALMLSAMGLFIYRAQWLDMRDKYYEMIKNDYDYYMTEYKEFIK